MPVVDNRDRLRAQRALMTGLTDRERNLLRMAQSKGVERILALYRKDFDSVEAVERELDRIREKGGLAVARARAREEGDDAGIAIPARGVVAAALDRAGLDERKDAELLSRAPASSGVGGRMRGAEPASNGAIRVHPPMTAGSALSVQERPSTSNGHRPAPATQRAGVAVSQYLERRDRLLELLGGQRMSQARLCEETGFTKSVVSAVLIRMEGDGLVERTGMKAYDCASAVRGSIVFRLVDEPEGCGRPAGRQRRCGEGAPVQHRRVEPSAVPAPARVQVVPEVAAVLRPVLAQRQVIEAERDELRLRLGALEQLLAAVDGIESLLADT